ncbi:MAG: FkbM family methyltransferase [Sulfitobacter sp.]
MAIKTKVVAECHGVKVPDSPMITPERAERINAARYEGQEIAGALQVIRQGDNVLEMGAGIGVVGGVVAKNGKPAKVISFEANPSLIEHINALYKLNRLGKKIEVRNEVLISAPDAPETMTFHIRNSYLGSSLIDSDKRATTQVDVPTASYTELRKTFTPDVILMDIEGGELEFLRHASLAGVRAIVIEFHPEAYGKEGMRECKSILENAGFSKVPEHSTRHVWTCTHEATGQPPVPEKGWSTSIETLDGALVVPPVQAKQNFVQEAGILDANGNYCATGALWRNGRSLTIAPKRPDNTPVKRNGTWLWGGVLWMHFGHFLVESSARLWALDVIDEKIDGILFMPKRPRNGSEVLEYQKKFLSLMGRDIAVECVDAPCEVERLIVPGQGFGLGEMISGTDAFRKAIAFHFAKEIKPDGPEKIYISRSRLPAGRGNLIGEAELEAHLAAQGYVIYHPQMHDLEHQIATYKAANQIIAAEGSALHLLAMVGHHDQKVAIIVRRPSGATRNLENHLTSFASIKPVTLTCLKQSWKPLGAAKPRLWMGELDMPALQQALAQAGFIDAAETAWDPLDASEVQARLGERFEAVA